MTTRYHRESVRGGVETGKLRKDGAQGAPASPGYNRMNADGCAEYCLRLVMSEAEYDSIERRLADSLWRLMLPIQGRENGGYRIDANVRYKRVGDGGYLHVAVWGYDVKNNRTIVENVPKLVGDACRAKGIACDCGIGSGIALEYAALRHK